MLGNPAGSLTLMVSRFSLVWYAYGLHGSYGCVILIIIDEITLHHT